MNCTCGNEFDFMTDTIDSEFFQKQYIDCACCGKILEWYECYMDDEGNIIKEFWHGYEVI